MFPVGGQETLTLGFALFVKHVLHCSIAFIFLGWRRVRRGGF